MDGYRQLKKLSRKGGFQHAIFFDTETQSSPCDKYPRGELLTLRFGHAIYIKLLHGKEIQRETLDFTDHLSFWEWVLLHSQARQPLWLFAHNLPFDLSVTRVWELVLAGILTLGGKPAKDPDKPAFPPLVVMDDPPTIVEFRTKNGGKIVAVDTLNYWRASLATLGKKVGLEKQEIDFAHADLTTLQAYCRNDVAILVHAVIGLLGWILENDYGAFRYSVPSLAFSVFRSRFYDGSIELHSNAQVRSLERSAYYGGRLECYRIGKVQEKVYELDVCALYPFVMRDQRYPIKLVEWSHKESDVDTLANGLASECCAKVRIKSKSVDYPVRLEQGLCHCVGEYDTWLCGPELAHAHKMGAIARLYSWSRYEMRPLFRPFVEHFWDRRREYEKNGDTLQAEFCKLMMNSLYGKFGQLSPKWEFDGLNHTGCNFGTIIEYDSVEKQTNKYRVIGDRMEKQNPNHHHDDGENASPIIAAYVTAYGREWMRYLKEIAGFDNVYYLVTDALLCNQVGYDNLANSKLIAERVPGMLSLKFSSNELDMRAIHQWTLGEEVKRGGVKRTAKQLSPTEFEEIHFEGLSAMLNLNDNVTPSQSESSKYTTRCPPPNMPLPGVVIYPQIKTLSLQYRKGVVANDGRVSPLILSPLASE
jgi:DNA polymerase type B, organellar and viral